MQINTEINNLRPRDLQSDDISVHDIVKFLRGTWRKLVFALFAGMVLGFCNWFFLVGYSAEYILLNNTNTNTNTDANTNTNTDANTNTNTDAKSTPSLDVVSWKRLQKSLPGLALQIRDSNKVPENQDSIFNQMANEQWWSKNVVPNYLLGKGDVKEFIGIGKDLDLASSAIDSFSLTAGGSSKAQSIKNVYAAGTFLRSGGAYIQLRSLLNAYRSQSLNADAEVQQKIIKTLIEMGYQQERVKNLEELYKRFPGGSGANGQAFYPSDSSAKYLPLTTQIIAAKSDINQSKERIVKLKKQLSRNTLLKTFLGQSDLLLKQEFNGIALASQLIALERNMHSKLVNGDLEDQEFLEKLHVELVDIQTRFAISLDSDSAPVASKKGMIKSCVGGSALAFFLMLLLIFCRRLFLSIKVVE